LPKIPVEDADLSAKASKAFERELAVAQILTALDAQDLEGAVQKYAAAVERHGGDFLETCRSFRRRLPAEMQAMFDQVVKLAARGDEVGN
jgi:hypothetical protein